MSASPRRTAEVVVPTSTPYIVTSAPAGKSRVTNLCLARDIRREGISLSAISDHVALTQIRKGDQYVIARVELEELLQ